MILSTYAGLVVNMDYVVFIAVKRQESNGNGTTAPPDGETASRFKVALFLPNRDWVVAAARLTDATVQFLRKEIARQWAEGARALDVNQTLTCHTDSGMAAPDRAAEGAYLASDAPQSAPTEGGV